MMSVSQRRLYHHHIGPSYRTSLSSALPRPTSGKYIDRFRPIRPWGPSPGFTKRAKYEECTRRVRQEWRFGKACRVQGPADKPTRRHSYRKGRTHRRRRACASAIRAKGSSEISSPLFPFKIPQLRGKCKGQRPKIGEKEKEDFANRFGARRFASGE